MSKITTHLIHFSHDHFQEEILDAPFIQPELLKPKKGFIWVHLEGERDVNHLRAIFNEFGIDTEHLEGMHDLNQRPKMALFKNYAYAVSKLDMLSLKKGKTYNLQSEKITLFFNDKVVLSHHPTRKPIFTGIREALKEDNMLRARGAVYLAHLLLDNIVDAYQPSLENYNQYLDHLEDSVIAHPTNETFLSVHDIKKQLKEVHSSLWAFTKSIKDLTDQPPAYLGDENLIHFQKLHEQAETCLNRVEGFRETASGLVDLFFSSQGGKLNEIMKVLTIVATIFTPLSYLTGLFSIGFYPDEPWWNPIQLNQYWGYNIVIGSALIIVIWMLYFFKRKGWMGSTQPTIPSFEEEK